MDAQEFFKKIVGVANPKVAAIKLIVPPKNERKS